MGSGQSIIRPAKNNIIMKRKKCIKCSNEGILPAYECKKCSMLHIIKPVDSDGRCVIRCQKESPCHVCESLEKSQREKCTTCSGKRVVTCMLCNGSGERSVRIECVHTCDYCEGDGYMYAIRE